MPADCYWMTGLPASGKITLARALASEIQQQGRPAFVLDGDELHQGLCADLGLTDADRNENIRRAGEVARLMGCAGVTVCCAFVSLFRADRDRVRALFVPSDLTEIQLDTSLGKPMRGDPKGLHTRARSGALADLTGWGAPYEGPLTPQCRLDAQQAPAHTLARRLIAACTTSLPSHP